MIKENVGRIIAANTYAERYPNREIKSHIASKRLLERFIVYGEGKETNMKKNSY